MADQYSYEQSIQNLRSRRRRRRDVGPPILRAVAEVVRRIVAVEPRLGEVYRGWRGQAGEAARETARKAREERKAPKAEAAAAVGIAAGSAAQAAIGRTPAGIGRAVRAIREPPFFIGPDRSAPGFDDVQIVRAV